MRHARIVGVGTKGVFLRVGEAEDRKPGDEESGDACEVKGSELKRIHGQIFGLKTVDPWNPDKISEREHTAESVSGDIHGGENSRLHENTVEDVKALHESHKDDAIRHKAVGTVLLRDESTVEENPAKHTRPELHKFFDVDLAQYRQSDTRVKLTADEPVVQDIAGVSASCQLP